MDSREDPGPQNETILGPFWDPSCELYLWRLPYAVGLAVGLENPAEPFLRLPETGIQAGLGCRIEDPVDGFDEDPCQALDDYAFWASLQWSL